MVRKRELTNALNALLLCMTSLNLITHQINRELVEETGANLIKKLITVSTNAVTKGLPFLDESKSATLVQTAYEESLLNLSFLGLKSKKEVFTSKSLEKQLLNNLEKNQLLPLIITNFLWVLVNNIKKQVNNSGQLFLYKKKEIPNEQILTFFYLLFHELIKDIILPLDQERQKEEYNKYFEDCEKDYIEKMEKEQEEDHQRWLSGGD